MTEQTGRRQPGCCVDAVWFKTNFAQKHQPSILYGLRQSGTYETKCVRWRQTLAHAHKSEDKGPPFLPVRGRGPTQAISKSILEFLANAQLRKTNQKMALEETECSHTSRFKEFISKSAENKLSNSFQIDFESAIDGLMTDSFHFADQILMKFARNGALYEMFDGNIEGWIQLLTFMDAVVDRALASLWFVYTVEKFIYKKLTEQSGII